VPEQTRHLRVLLWRLRLVVLRQLLLLLLLL
jgi:hypothetical protein